MNFFEWRIPKILFFLLLLGSIPSRANMGEGRNDELARTWANTKMEAMTLEQKVGQLLMVQGYSNKGEKHRALLRSYVRDYHVGGIAFFQGNPKDQLDLNRELQSLTKVPLLMAIDAEWGLGMRLDNSISFPKQMTLGAIQDNRLIYEMGKEIGSQLKRIGIHLNFAPVVDINTRPDNPVINQRSFGDNKKNVSRKAYAYMKGMQDVGILACAKHFPGHGSTDKDSHKTLPTINKTITELHEEELFPFRLMFKQGIKSVMVGHLFVPVLDNRENRPSSLSYKIVDQSIRQQLQYKGLIITDALEMRGVADHFESGEMEVEAFLAGNDILTVSQSISRAHKSLMSAVNSGKITKKRLDASLMRILMAKFDAGLFFPPQLEEKDLQKELMDPKALALKEDLYRNAITYLPGQGKHLPISSPAQKKIASIVIGDPLNNPFQQRLASYGQIKNYRLGKMPANKELQKIKKELSAYDEIIVSFHAMNNSYKKQFGIPSNVLALIDELQVRNQVRVVLFGNPYSLEFLGAGKDILLAYENDDMAQDMAAQALFGSIAINGKLPVRGGDGYEEGSGKYVPDANIMSYCLPEHAGLSSDSLAIIDSLVAEMIAIKAAPGCQVLIAKDGQIVYDRSFGHHTYTKEREVKKSDKYDLASVTKIMATTIAAMRLYEQGKIDIFKPVSHYVDGYIDTSDKADITIIEVLTHHAGLKAWIPFYRQTLDTLNNNLVVPSKKFYRKKKEGKFNVKVASKLYIDRSYADSMSSLIYGSPLRKNKDYRYSDLGLYMVRDVVDAVAGMPMDEYLQKEFYEPMGLVNTGYNPLDRHPANSIVPSENDNYYRGQILRGYVHDMGAAMLGGVSGHAGLFSNSGDLAVLMQMLLNKGVYGDTKYFQHKTVYTFTTRYHRSSRRGIGFDMKELDQSKNPNMSDLAPASTFGHLGFTGTCVFGDPDNNIVYVFLSNRTFPSMNNNKLGNENYRSRIQSVIYRSFIDKL